LTFQPKDLVVLVPDNNMQSAIVGILEKHRRLGARAITLLGPYVDSKRDSGVYLRAHALLRELQREASYALVLLDHDGCGSTEAREAVEAEVEMRLAQSVWARRSAVVVIEPELEN